MIEIPGYRMIRELGQGATGTVYLAVQESLNREVALKLLSPALASDRVASERFLREGRTAAHLAHRNIVGVHDVGVHAGQPYLAMEYVPGGTVPTDGMRDPQAALAIVLEIALALDHAHAQGVVHRDVKPENILVRADGSHALSDFGVARTAETSTVLTQEGMTAGTPHYMSPEQLQGLPLDGRSDLYGLGVVLFQLLTGKLPYQGTDPMAVALKHLHSPLPDLPDHLAPFQFLVNSLMAKDPAHRPRTGAEAARMIRAIQTGKLLSNPDWLFAPASRTAEWRRWLLDGRPWLLASVGAVALAWAGWMFWPRAGGESLADASSSAAPDLTAASPAEAPRSIAVLPLVNLSHDPANEYFSDGLAETTLDMLARVPDLRVIARTSSFAFKDQALDVREIGRRLDVAHLLEGSVQQSGDTLRITMQLVRTSDGAHLWSRQYDRKLADLFKIQDEVAVEVVKALQVALPAAGSHLPPRQRTDNIAAYQEYLKGVALLPDRKAAEMRQAAAHFERAIAIDPTYARAYAAAATTYGLLMALGTVEDSLIARRAAYIDRALELDPNLGEAHIARAGLLNQAGDLEGAERAFERGTALAPSYTIGYQWYAGMLLHKRGLPERALPLLERAIALDPLGPSNREQYARALAAVGRVDEAFAVSDRLLREHPDFARNHRLRADLLVERGDLVGALRAEQQALAHDPDSEKARLMRCFTILSFGARAEAEQCAKAIARQYPLSDTQRVLAAELLIDARDFKGALRLYDEMKGHNPWARASLLEAAGRPAEASELHRTLVPELFKQPLGPDPIPYPMDPVLVAASLMKTGSRPQAVTLLRHGLRESASRPRRGQFGLGWSDVYAYTLLGDLPRACTALGQVVADGIFVEYRVLDADPIIDPLRSQPCYGRHLGVMRAKAQAEVTKARRAGLLPGPG